MQTTREKVTTPSTELSLIMAVRRQSQVYRRRRLLSPALWSEAPWRLTAWLLRHRRHDTSGAVTTSLVCLVAREQSGSKMSSSISFLLGTGWSHILSVVGQQAVESAGVRQHPRPVRRAPRRQGG